MDEEILSDSILISVKKVLGISEEYNHFDADIIMHINTAFMVLNQIGVGSIYGFTIESSEEVWSDLTENIEILSAIKTYVYLYVRSIFDPPSSSFVLTSMKEQMEELKWRILVMAEEVNNV